MTPQEAIKILNTTFHLNCKVSEAQAELKARVKAIEALEKQIPKKPSAIGSLKYNHRCPNCGDSKWSIETSKLNPQPKYCPNCGQTLDWSEEE